MQTKIEPYKGIAVTYDEVRPSYPDMLIQDVISKTNLITSSKILEIGAGTGKATVQFAEKGYSINAIEIGEDMAEILKSKCTIYPKVTIQITSFEDWKPDQEIYDMIYCAQAFHWLDVNVKYKKCHDLLKDNGYLALFWYSPCMDDFSITISNKVDEILNKHLANNQTQKETPQRPMHSGVADDDTRQKEIEDSGLFKIVEKLEYTYELKEDVEKFIQSKNSIPGFAASLDCLDEESINIIKNEINEILSQYGGYYSMKFNYTLFITQKL